MLKINKKTLPFWTLTIAIFILVIDPSLIQTPKVNGQWSNQVYAMRYRNLHLDSKKEKAEYHLFYKNTEVQK